MGNGQEMAQSERNPTPKTEVGNNQINNQVLRKQAGWVPISPKGGQSVTIT